MDNLIKACAAVLLVLVISLVLVKQGKDISLILSIMACCMLLGLAVEYLSPVISFLYRLKRSANLNNEMFNILLKAIGIAFIGEIVSLICLDAGNAAIGKVVHLLTTCGILYLSLPLFDALLTLIEEMLNTL